MRRRTRIARRKRTSRAAGRPARPRRYFAEVEVRYWFHPTDDLSGWHKTQSRETRMKHLREEIRERMRKHGWSRRRAKLSVARALLALSNVTRDPKTKMVARRDALDLFKQLKED